MNVSHAVPWWNVNGCFIPLHAVCVSHAVSCVNVCGWFVPTLCCVCFSCVAVCRYSVSSSCYVCSSCSFMLECVCVDVFFPFECAHQSPLAAQLIECKMQSAVLCIIHYPSFWYHYKRIIAVVCQFVSYEDLLYMLKRIPALELVRNLHLIIYVNLP